MRELLANLRFLQDKLNKFVECMAAATSDIEELILSQSETKQDGFKDAINTLADMMNLHADPDLTSLSVNIKQLISIFQTSLTQADEAEGRIEFIVDAVTQEFQDDIRAKFNVSALSEYGQRVMEKTNQTLSKINGIYQAYIEKIDAVIRVLQSEKAAAMAPVNIYHSRLGLLDFAKKTIQKNNTLINEELDELNECADLMRQCMKKSGEVMVAHRLEEMIKKLIAFPIVNDEESKKLMHQTFANLEHIVAKYKAEGKLLKISFASIEDLLNSYKDLVNYIYKLARLFVEKDLLKFSINQSIEDNLKKKLLQLPDYQTAKKESEEFYAKHHLIYNQAFEHTYQAIRYLGDLAKTKKRNESLLAKDIPEVEIRIKERIRVKTREDEYILELHHFDSDLYFQVYGEGFKKLKDEFFFTGKSRQILAELMNHANGHLIKGGLIKSFITDLENAKSLADLISLTEKAIESNGLMQCRTTIARQLGMKSTTGNLLIKLDSELKHIIRKEKQQHLGFDSVKSAINAEKDAIFAEELKCNFETIYQDFINKIDKKFASDSAVSLLKEELIRISLSKGDNAGKVCRMALALHHVRQTLTANMLAAGNLNNPLFYGLNQFVAAHPEALKTVRIHQGESPFSCRYQELRKRLEHVQTFRTQTLEDFWNAVDRVAGNPDSEVVKLTKMRQVLYHYYCGIRESYRGSPGLFFSKGSRLAAAIGEFLIAEDGFYMKQEDVPQRIGFRLF